MGFFDTERDEADAKAAAVYADELRAMADAYGVHRSDDWRGLLDRWIAEDSIRRMANRYACYAELYQPTFKPRRLS